MFLLNRSEGKLVYVAKAYILVFVIAVSVSFVMTMMVPQASAPSIDRGIKGYFIAGLIAPLIETLLMIPILAAIKLITENFTKTCLFSATVWAVLHSVQHPVWGIVIFSSFFIYTVAFKVWEAESMSAGTLVAGSIHTLNNLTVLVIGE